MSWSLYENGKSLKPLVFSNSKTQEDVVNEVIEAINKGHKVIFIKGKCGTGKSAIALNLSKEIGRASVVVPVKALQKQYEDDYTNKKYLLKNNGEKLKIKIITGRQNFTCPFLKEENLNIEIKETNSKLSDFQNLRFENKRENSDKNKENSCNNNYLPCKIEIKEKNIKQIRQYLRKNPRVKFSDFDTISHVRRMSIAPVCPYWSPIVPSDANLNLDNSTPKTYKALNNINYTIYQRKKGCGYYDQYQAYIDADVIIFNSQKYKLENLMNRKPQTDIEIIDECDEFLDSFSNQKKININRLNFSLGSLYPESRESQKIINNLIKLTSEILKNKKFESLNKELIPLKKTPIFQILDAFTNSSFLDSVEYDEENYCYHVNEVARTFEGFFDETFVSFDKEDKNLIVKIITVNLEKRFDEILNKNKIFVMMSGTIHSEKVLKEIFGLQNFKIIEAETKMPGKIIPLRTGLEINCKYENFQTGKVTRKQYLEALEKSIKQAEKPTLVHVNS